jgi:hypothetical protein
MRKAIYMMAVVATSIFMTSTAQAGSLEGVWKIESGRWGSGDSEMVYPGNPASDEGGMAFRTFTASHHFFISSWPAENIFNASMSRYSIEGNTIHMEKVVTKNPNHLQGWDLTFDLDGDRLTLEMEDLKEVWVRVE